MPMAQKLRSQAVTVKHDSEAFYYKVDNSKQLGKMGGNKYNVNNKSICLLSSVNFVSTVVRFIYREQRCGVTQHMIPNVAQHSLVTHHAEFGFNG